MKVILKHVLFDFDNMKEEDEGHITIEMHMESEILEVGVQGHKICLWAIEDVDSPMTRRNFVVYGTGFALEDREHVFIGTVFMGQYVWHVFEQKVQK